MLNLHPPFRRTDAGGNDATIVAEEDGRLCATLIGAPAGEVWVVQKLEIEPGRLDDLGPRILAVADALAADEGLASVTIATGGSSAELRALLDREGFRADERDRGTLVRPVIPQG